MKTPKHKVNAVSPRLSDEDLDPLEQDDADVFSMTLAEGWLPWDGDDIVFIHQVIEDMLNENQRIVIEAFLDGRSYKDIAVTEKFWRYHFEKAIERIRKEMLL